MPLKPGTRVRINSKSVQACPWPPYGSVISHQEMWTLVDPRQFRGLCYVVKCDNGQTKPFDEDEIEAAEP